MKYLCLAYEEESILNALSKSEWDLLRRETLDYVEELRQKGLLLSAEPLQSVKSAATSVTSFITDPGATRADSTSLRASPTTRMEGNSSSR